MNFKTIKTNFFLGLWSLLVVTTSCKKEFDAQENSPVDETLKATVVNAVYIDPTYTGSVKAGTLSQPYSSWSSIVWKSGYSYLLKCGTTLNTGSSLAVRASNVTIGSYGTGNRPLISSSAPNGQHIISISGQSYVTIRDIEVQGTNNATSCICFSSSPYASVINCKVHNAEWGLRNMSSTGSYTINNTEVYMTGDDGCYTQDCGDIELSGSYIHDVNQKYFVNTSETYSGGDVFQMVNCKSFNIHDNTLDHSSTGNKFCIISACSNSTYAKTTGSIEHNHFIRKGDIDIYLNNAQNIVIRYNRFDGGADAIYNYSTNLMVCYNEFVNLTGYVFMLAQTGSTTSILNNTFYNFSNLSNNYTETVQMKNNIFSNCTGTLFASGTNPTRDYNCYYKISNMGSSNIGTHSVSADPQFNNPSVDFCLKSTSPCINKGTNIWTSYTDFSGIAVPYSGIADIGAHEYNGGTTTTSGGTTTGGTTSGGTTTGGTTTSGTAPTVKITSPSNGANFKAPATITFTTTTTSANGIAKVEFFNGSTKIGESTVAPYTFTWSNVAFGSYQIKAVATDKANLQGTSSIVYLYVNN